MSKSIIYYAAPIFTVLFYLLKLTIMNAKGLKIQIIDNENSFVYFLRCSAIGLSYCLLLASILFLIAIAFRRSLITVFAGLALFLIDFVMKAAVNWCVAEKIVSRLILEELMMKEANTELIFIFVALVAGLATLTYCLSMLIFYKRKYK